MSGGPKTSAGKAIAKMNALSHGLRSPAPVIPGEDASEWERHHAGIVDALSPVGAVEEALTSRIALLLWRMGRVARYETAIAAGSLADAERDYAREQAERQRFVGTRQYTPNTPAACRAEMRDAAANVRLLRGLDARPADAALTGVTAGMLLYQAGKVAAEQTDNEAFDPDAVEYPGLPAGEEWDDQATVTAGTLRTALVALATAAGIPRDDLVAATIRRYESEGRMAKARLEEVTREIERMEAARSLLPGADLEKVQRYEAHLHRQLIQTLHELEAMQARRQGNAAPLARLDVSGLDAAG